MKEKICEFCNLPFIPNSAQQKYCKRPHYMKCPVCGKNYLVTNNENLKRPPVACSYACRAKRTQETSMKKYGMKAPGNNPEARKKAENTMMNKFGVKHSMQSEEVKDKAKQSMLEKYGVTSPMKSKLIKEKVARTNMERYGSTTYLTSEKGKKEYKQIMLEKYGVEHPFQSEEIKNRVKKHMLEKYGSEWFTSSEFGKNRMKEVIQAKYGVDYVTQLESVKNKSKKTIMDKYGVDNCFKSEMIKKKIKQSMLAKYGAEWILSVPEIREKVMKTTMERYGVPFYIMKPEVKLSSGCISKFNLQFADKLRERNIEFNMEYRIDSKSFDFYISQKNLIVELNPTYTHNLIGNHWDKHGKKSNYHKDRCMSAFSDNKSIRCVFDWDIEDELLAELTAERTQVNIKDCIIYKVNKKVGVEFLSRCGRSRSKHYPRKMMILSLVQGDKIIAAMAVVLNKNVHYPDYEFAIIDYGTEWGVECNQAFQHLLQEMKRLLDYEKFLLEIEPDRILIEDIAYLNLKQLDWTSPRILWSRKKIKIPATLDYRKNMSMIENGWLPIEDCGKLIFECS